MATDEQVDVREDPAHSPFPDMVWIPGGTFRMGSDKHYPEERPVHRVTVDGFWMDRCPVTNERFARFVEATRSRDVRGDPARSRATIRARCRRCSTPARWCSCSRPARSIRATSATGGSTCAGADWRHPHGPDSSIERPRRSSGRARDVRRCRSVRARGRARRCRPRPSGSSPRAAASTAPPMRGATSSSPGDRHMANTWQGEFPWQNIAQGRLRAARRRSARFRPTATGSTT